MSSSGFALSRAGFALSLAGWGAPGWNGSLVAAGAGAIAGALVLVAFGVRSSLGVRADDHQQRIARAAAAAERARLAREMHDSLSKTLDALALGAAALPTTLHEPARATRLAQTLRDGSLDAARDARDLIDELRSQAMDAPLSEIVWATCHEWSTSTGIALTLLGERVDAPARTGIELCWILREALRNVAAHAGAGAVTVTLARRGTDLVLEVEDDGRGLSTIHSGRNSRDGRHGLVGMRERARLCGGCLEMTVGPAGGTVVRAVVPAERVGVAPAVSRRRYLAASVVASLTTAAALLIAAAAGGPGSPPTGDSRAGGVARPGRTGVDPATGAPTTPSMTAGVVPVASTAARPTPRTARSSAVAPSPPGPPTGVAPAPALGTDCRARYQILNEWQPGYFLAEVHLTNLGVSTVDGWTLRFSYGADQSIFSHSGAMVQQSGRDVTATAEGTARTIDPGATVTFQVQGTGTLGAPAPTAFSMNGVSCR